MLNQYKIINFKDKIIKEKEVYLIILVVKKLKKLKILWLNIKMF